MTSSTVVVSIKKSLCCFPKIRKNNSDEGLSYYVTTTDRNIFVLT